MASFFDLLFQHHPEWKTLPLVPRSGNGWQGRALQVPPPDKADLTHPLLIEEVGNEITIDLDHAHIHLSWPPEPWRPDDPFIFIDAILSEEIVAVSGWINGQPRVGSLCALNKAMKSLILPGLQKVRIRSWKGTHDSDEEARDAPSLHQAPARHPTRDK
ncbi:MAG: hypothetical protein KGH75_11845 [Rhodospirillales bacterium]|nr:hypothetical protein [Rhodospirillales bacterium]